MVGSYDFSRHAAAPLGATGLIGQRLPDEGKRRPLGSGFLDSSVSKCQPLPGPRSRRRLGRWASFETHFGTGDLVTRPDVHVIQNIRLSWKMTLSCSTHGAPEHSAGRHAMPRQPMHASAAFIFAGAIVNTWPPGIMK